MLNGRPSTQRRHLRLLTLLAVLVAFDAVAAVAAYVLAHVFVATIMLTQFNPEMAASILDFGLIPLELFVAVATPVILVAQSVFGYRSTFRDVETIDASAAEDIDDSPITTLRARVSKLAHTVGMSPPAVELVDAPTPNSFVASRPGEQTLFVTTGLLAELDGDELDAVLAHELAHLDNGDAFIMTAAAFVPTMTTKFCRSFTNEMEDDWLAARLRGRDIEWSLRDLCMAYNHIRTLLFMVIALPITALLYLASTACYRLLSRIREDAADAGAVAICGSPAALASALETLTEDRRPETDLRTGQTGIRELCILPYPVTTETEDDADPDRFDRIATRWNRFCERVLPSSHPEPDERIAALRDRQRTRARSK